MTGVGPRAAPRSPPEPALETAVLVFSTRCKAPFNLSNLAEEAASRAVAAAPSVRRQSNTVLAERESVAAALARPGFGAAVLRVVPSEANILLVELQGREAVCEALARTEGVVVRYRGGILHCRDCVRISIGTWEENEKLLAGPARVLGGTV